MKRIKPEPPKKYGPTAFCAKPLLALAPYPLPPHQNREMATRVIYPYPPVTCP